MSLPPSKCDHLTFSVECRLYSNSYQLRAARAALLKDEVVIMPSSMRISMLFSLMGLDSGERMTSAKGHEKQVEVDNDGDADVTEVKEIDRMVPVDHDQLRNHLININQETFAVADKFKSEAVRSESEKWTDLHVRNKTAIRNRPAQGGPRPVIPVASTDTMKPTGKRPAPRKGKNVPAADKGVSKHISAPKMVPPTKKESSKQTIDWNERGEKGKVMVEGTGKVSVQRPVSAPAARQAWRSEVTPRAEKAPAASQSQTAYRPSALAVAGGAAAALGTRPATVRRGIGILDAQEQLCLIHEMIYSPRCPYPHVMEEVEHGFAAHQFGDCETALQCYEDAYGMWVDDCVEDTGCDVHPEVRVFLLNAIGMVHQTAGRPEDTLAAFLDAKTEANNLDPDHPDVALSLSNIGAAYYRLGSIGMAIEFYDQAIEVREAALGKRHVDTALLYNNKACCLSLRGDTTATRALLHTAHEIFVDGLGATHPRTFAAVRNVARASRLPLDVDRTVGRLPRCDMMSLGSLGAKASKTKKPKGKGKGKGKGTGKGKGKSTGKARGKGKRKKK